MSEAQKKVIVTDVDKSEFIKHSKSRQTQQKKEAKQEPAQKEEEQEPEQKETGQDPQPEQPDVNEIIAKKIKNKASLKAICKGYLTLQEVTHAAKVLADYIEEEERRIEQAKREAEETQRKMSETLKSLAGQIDDDVLEQLKLGQELLAEKGGSGLGSIKIPPAKIYVKDGKEWTGSKRGRIPKEFDELKDETGSISKRILLNYLRPEFEYMRDQLEKEAAEEEAKQ